MASPAPPPRLKPTHDHLSSLPPEVLQEIASYLYASHVPDKAHHELGPSASIPSFFSRDLMHLASANKTLNQQTNNWAHHFLHSHRAITRYKDYKTASAARKQRPLRELLQWSTRNCVFCGKKSTRCAILMNGLRCCRDCDREQWPDKLTKTEVKRKHKLEEHQILPDQHPHFRLLARYPGLKPLRYGTYFSAGVLTTMFLRDEVEAFARLAHGDLKGHLKGRELARRARERRKKERLAMKQVEEYEAAEAEVSRAGGGGEVIVIDDDEDDAGDGIVRNGNGGGGGVEFDFDEAHIDDMFSSVLD